MPPRAGETSLASDALSEPGPRRLGTTVPAVQRLLDWATDTSDGARHLCALLGDVGMGKTTTIKLFTQELLALRERDRSAPLPILFDLRDLPPAVVREGAGLPGILTALLEHGDLGAGLSAEQVLDLVAGGDCVLIFDGLDEVLVHLDPHAGQVFTRTLWRATEDTWRSHPADRMPARPSRLLLSCRTHYFRTIRHETTHFTGQHRDGPAGADYLALLMLPFGDEQVRAYLTANLPGADVGRLLKLIDSVHNLREITERPLTLRMVAEQLETVERAKLAGRTVRAVDLYGSFVSQWLERDDGKHCLLPEHKELLMEHLAAELWRSGRTAWGVADVEQWLLEFLHGHPDLELHYPARDPELWKEDLRTATFLIRRDDDTFGFAHTREVTGGGWSPDGTRLLTTSADRTARVWDAATGRLVGWQLEQLPKGELTVWSSPGHELLGASEGAWRWLGWLMPQDGRLVRLPAETWGPLPPLDRPAAASD